MAADRTEIELKPAPTLIEIPQVEPGETDPAEQQAFDRVTELKDPHQPAIGRRWAGALILQAKTAVALIADRTRTEIVAPQLASALCDESLVDGPGDVIVSPAGSAGLFPRKRIGMG